MAEPALALTMHHTGLLWPMAVAAVILIALSAKLAWEARRG